MREVGPGTGKDHLPDREALRQDYRAAFLRFVPRRDDAALLAGYELGRSAVERGFSILDLAEMHHDVLLDVLQDNPVDALTDVATAASEFFLEVLATYDMAQRLFRKDL